MNIANMIKNTAVAATLAVIPLSSVAGQAAAQIEGEIGARILRSAPSVAPGYNAIMAEKDGKKRIFYESADGNYLFYGMMYDANGMNITAVDVANLTAGGGQTLSAAPAVTAQNAHLSQGVSQSDYSQVMAAINNASYIKEGSGNVVYVVFDPNCPYCKELYRKTRQHLASNEIRWIPVGVLTPPVGDSQRKAAAILRNAGSGMTNLQLVQPVKPSEEETKRLDANIDVMVAANSNQVPLLIWQEGGNTRVVKGLPSDGEINAIFTK